jgi:transposase-like protein
MYSHPKDNEIRKAYESGLGIGNTSKALGLGRKTIYNAIQRMGITRPHVINDLVDKEKQILDLARKGYGHRSICKMLGIKSELPCRKLIKKHGIRHKYRVKDDRSWGWAIAEIESMADAERAHQRWWREANPAARSAQMRRYYANHEHRKEQSRISHNKRYNRIKNEPWNKARQFARDQLRRIVEQVRQCQFSKRTIDYLGCTYQQAADYITTQLQHQWTWQNYGIVWEIDHKTQLSDGNLLDEAHMHRVCHYTNLRPMSVTVNRTRPRGAWAGRQQSA